MIDCCTKECVGYSIADHMRTCLVIDALDMAARNGRLNPGAIFHTDRGSQYQCRSDRRVRAITKITQGGVVFGPPARHRQADFSSSGTPRY